MSEMFFSRRTKIILMGLLILLNILLRFQVVQNEIGWDSFSMHIMTNSLTEYGYARWWLHPLSVFGLYPASYTSTMHFLLSGIEQTTGLEMRWAIFLYCMFFGLLSMFTAYLMAGEIIDDDLFKFLVAFGFSTSPGVLGYTTWTIPTRGLFVVLAPLVVYLLLKCRTSLKYVPLTFLLVIFLSATHHLFYFLIPAFFAFFFLSICFKLRKHINIKIPEKFATFVPITGLIPFISITGFLCMFSIPFFTGHFIEHSRYASIDVNYVRYMGLLIIFAIGGLAYLIFKNDKRFGEWFLLLSLIFLTTFIYLQTYMKWFLPIFLVPLAGISLLNILRASEKRKYILQIVAIFLLLVLSFSAYYQFLHTYRTSPYDERYIEESTYKTGRWMKDNILNGSAISNDRFFGCRIFAASETSHVLTSYRISDQIYGFVSINISKFKRYSVMDEKFWFKGYEGPDPGEAAWDTVNKLWISPQEFDITYVVENKKCKGNIYWHHGIYPSELLHLAYNEKDCIYDSGDAGIWRL
ncbi:MAG: hypothetical protein Q6363_004685 [Candidatus Njordarchaeota archaeon]